MIALKDFLGFLEWHKQCVFALGVSQIVAVGNKSTGSIGFLVDDNCLSLSSSIAGTGTENGTELERDYAKVLFWKVFCEGLQTVAHAYYKERGGGMHGNGKSSIFGLGAKKLPK